MSGDGFLHKYFLNNPGRRLHKYFHYFDIYALHLERFRGKQPVVLEIGVAGGGSLDMWKAYFGPGTRVIGIDIEPKCKSLETDGVEIFIGSQDDPALVAKILDKYPTLDIVIDDGSHQMHHMVASFNLLYDSVQPYGVYLVEDLLTCYMPDFGGGVKKAGSFMEFAKDKVDELHAVYTNREIPVSKFTTSTSSINFYDLITVFEKRPQGTRKDFVTMRA